MAGSFRHVDKEGKFRFDLIENLGDAHEACHEMWWLIRHLATEEEIVAAEAAFAAHIMEHGTHDDYWDEDE